MVELAGERLPDQLRLMAAAYPDAMAYRNLGNQTSITFLQWERRSNQLARGWRERGIRKGDLVAIYLEAAQILDWIVAYSAVHKLGAVAVPTNNRLTPTEVRRVFDHAEISAVVASGTYDSAVEPLLGLLASLRVVVTVGPSTLSGAVDLEAVMSDDYGEIQEPIAEDDLADVVYTSGTTGMPKGVAVRHRHVALLPNTHPEWRGSAWLTATPVFTFAGLGFIYNPMKTGMSVLYLPKFDARQWLDIVERERPTIAFLVPAMAQLLIHHPAFATADLSSLTTVSLGSAPLAPETLSRLQAKLPAAAVLNSYGMTEGGYATFTMDPEGARKRPGAVGRPKPPTEVRIVEDGRALEAGAVGEVITRNPNGHREYYKDPEATARIWDGGWLRTGDLGYLDEDGYLYISGRKKEMIIRGGMNIYANDVEAVLMAHPDVVEAAVVPVPHPVLGEDVAAYVVCRPGIELTGEALQEFARTQLADYKVPRHMTFLAELPRNAGGKVIKRDLVAAAATMPPAR